MHAMQQMMPSEGQPADHHQEVPAEISEEFTYHIAWLRVLEIWFHHAHWTTKGETYYGDHLLFERIYNDVSELVDPVAEKAVAMCGVKVADTHTCSKLIAEMLCSYPSPSRADEATMIAATGLALVKDYLETLDETYKRLKSAGAMTMGLDDLLMSNANKLEEFVYLLKQRVQKSLG
jgi:DNA-binding ferritin-like protein